MSTTISKSRNASQFLAEEIQLPGIRPEVVLFFSRVIVAMVKRCRISAEDDDTPDYATVVARLRDTRLFDIRPRETIAVAESVRELAQEASETDVGLFLALCLPDLDFTPAP